MVKRDYIIDKEERYSIWNLKTQKKVKECNSWREALAEIEKLRNKKESE